ncbi:MAG: hypothetical protein N3F05_00715 [Candidatus Diapherotrites archaeon]|nr:hypothetical protein [Candidatus Diapherotrites archaeon]
MVSKEAVLLILKQRQGIKYNDVLSSILSDYSSINSARAALSRIVRYFSALGYITRKSGSLYITDKGNAYLYSRMKSKLIIKLNSSIKEKNVNETVKQLSVLIERSKIEDGLLDIARKNAGFYLCEVEQIWCELDKQSKQLAYLSGVLKKQIEMLREMDFPNKRVFSRDLLKEIFARLFERGEKDTLVITAPKQTLDTIALKIGLQTQANTLAVPPDKAFDLLDFLEEKNVRVSIALHGFLFSVGENIEVVAPASKLDLL